ncbi:50S ribosomal protein L25/general stress protein Ctc [Yimella sp. cx-51]|uniref:50S ribosomal protein L25/general stress protein Ctc n=1 Tax=Yimella sp. cx-51 TaxID=2770551 RepID=UPI00165E28C1|nr:50S ribosomal protein L25/general stress protein Ctc [Yimella sp. cx-51]MBC9956177.1 50S ribosomal protein L25/general stress protein Ctc [Yimella sp. cx-51]MBD2760820.1 50S ribosomal protein L25/general stress protein Ctc [Yimella sp. cx-573]QTH38670.1 50S ribosomal protein L25/general stress protein Ctc [Yimella sp. cx-51]
MAQTPDLRLVAEARTEFGKGAARRIRRADKIPAVLYGHGSDPVHVTLPGHDTMLALKGNANAVLTIVMPDGDDQLALAKDVQREVLRPFIEHIDLIMIRKGEKVIVDVPVIVEGDAAPETNVITDSTVLSVEADALSIPESFTVSVEGLEAGSQILAKDVQLPSGVTLISDEELLVVNVTQQVSAEELEAELAEAEDEAGIEREESDEEKEEAAEGAESSEESGEGDDA